MNKQRQPRSLAFNAILNTLRQLGAIAFPLITFPYVSRVLEVGNYGKYTFSNSIISYFTMIAALGISNYAIREGSGFRKDKPKLESFVDEVFTINIVTMIVSYILLFAVMLLWPKLRGYWLLLIVQSFTIFFNTIGVEWLYTIFEDFTYVTIRSLLVQLVALILMFIFVRTSNDYVTYAVITVFAAGGANVFGFFYANKYVRLKLVSRPHFRVHLPPMFLLFFNNVAVIIYGSSDLTLLGVFKGDTAVGLYNVSVRIYTIVKQLLNAMVVVTLPRLSFYLQEGKYREYQKVLDKVFRILMLLVVPSIVGLIMLSQEIIIIIAGKSYVEASTSLQLLSVGLLFSVLASFIWTGILLPRKLEKKILVATISGAVVNFVLNLALIPLLGINGSALTTALSEAIVCLLSYCYAKQYYNFRRLLSSFVLAIFGSISIVVICIFVRSIGLGVLFNFVLSVVLSVLGYALVILLSLKIMSLAQPRRKL